VTVEESGAEDSTEEEQLSQETVEESIEVQKDPWLLTVTVSDSNTTRTVLY